MPRAFDARERQSIEAALKEAALGALRNGGMRNCTVASLCRAAGISKGAFYGFYENKEHLVLTLLREAEVEMRERLHAALDEPDALERVLTLLFEGVVEHPFLALITNPDDYQWLTRALSPALITEARQDDRRWFADLRERLIEREGLDPAVSAEVFAAIPGAALAFAQGRELTEPATPRIRRLLIEALVLRLQPPSATSSTIGR